jgi:hypothetical protein
VHSPYVSRRSADGEPFESGSNSVQLLYDETRWWIVSVMWKRRGQVEDFHHGRRPPRRHGEGDREERNEPRAS